MATDESTKVFAAWIVLPLSCVLSAVLMAGCSQIVWLPSSVPRYLSVPLIMFTWLMLAGGFMGQFVRWMRVKDYAPEMRLRHRKAARILSSLRNREYHRPYFVFLRSFETDASRCVWFPTSDKFEYATTFDDELSFAFDPIPIVAVGNVGEGKRVGVAQVPSTDESWRADVDLLLCHARGIIVWPWHTPGILEEIERIAHDEQLRRKTIFFMPPTRLNIAIPAFWGAMRHYLAQHEVPMPTHFSCGAIFAMNANDCPGPPFRGEGFDGNVSHWSDLKRLIESLLTSPAEATANPPVARTGFRSGAHVKR